MHNKVMHAAFVLDPEKFHVALAKAGYGSLSQLAATLGIHRNTLHHYLSGAPVFSESLSKIFRALGVDPAELIRKIGKSYSIETIAPVTDGVLNEFPKCAIVLFGSRARGNARRFSDFDLGVFSGEGLPHDRYLRMLERKCELEEDLPVSVDLVDLTRADAEFLRNIAPDVKFVAGRFGDWLALKRKIDGAEIKGRA